MATTDETEIPAQIIFEISKDSFRNIEKVLRETKFKIGINRETIQTSIQKALKSSSLISAKVNPKILRDSINNVLSVKRRINAVVGIGKLKDSIDSVFKKPILLKSIKINKNEIKKSISKIEKEQSFKLRINESFLNKSIQSSLTKTFEIKLSVDGGKINSEISKTVEIAKNSLKSIGNNIAIELSNLQAKAKKGTVGTFQESEMRTGDQALRSMDRKVNIKGKLKGRSKAVFVPAQNAAELERTITLMRKLSGAVDSLTKEQRALIKEYSIRHSLEKSLNRLTGESSAQMQKFGDKVSAVTQRMLLWGGSSMIVWGTIRKLKQGLSIITDYDTAFIELRKVLKGTEEDFKRLQQTSFQFANEFGVSIQNVTKSFVIFAQQGKSVADIISLTRTAAIGANTTLINTAEVTELLTAAMNQFGIAAENSLGIIDKLTNVAANNAITSKNLGDALRRAGAAASEAGVSLDQFNGIVATIGTATRQTGQMIGTSLRFIFQKIRTEKAISALKNVGIATEEANGNFRSAFTVLGELASKFDSLSDSQRITTAQAIAGVRHYNSLIITLRNWDQVTSATNDSINSQGSALEKNAMAVASIEKRFQKLKNVFEELAITIGEGPLIGFLIDATLGFSSLLKGVSSLVNQLPILRDLLLGVGAAVMIGKAGNFFDRKKESGGFGSMLLSPMFFGQTEPRKKRRKKRTATEIIKAGIKDIRPLDIMKKTPDMLQDKFEKLNKGIRSLGKVGNKVLGGLMGVTGGLLSSLISPIGLITFTLPMLASVFSSLFKSEEELNQEFQKTMSALEFKISKLKKVSAEVQKASELVNMLGKQSKKVQGPKESKLLASTNEELRFREQHIKKLGELIGSIGHLPTGLITGFDSFGNAIINANINLSDFKQSMNEVIRLKVLEDSEAAIKKITIQLEKMNAISINMKNTSESVRQLSSGLKNITSNKSVKDTDLFGLSEIQYSDPKQLYKRTETANLELGLMGEAKIRVSDIQKVSSDLNKIGVMFVSVDEKRKKAQELLISLQDKNNGKMLEFINLLTNPAASKSLDIINESFKDNIKNSNKFNKELAETLSMMRAMSRLTPTGGTDLLKGAKSSVAALRAGAEMIPKFAQTPEEAGMQVIAAATGTDEVVMANAAKNIFTDKITSQIKKDLLEKSKIWATNIFTVKTKTSKEIAEILIDSLSKGNAITKKIIGDKASKLKEDYGRTADAFGKVISQMANTFAVIGAGTTAQQTFKAIPGEGFQGIGKIRFSAKDIIGSGTQQDVLGSLKAIGKSQGISKELSDLFRIDIAGSFKGEKANKAIKQIEIMLRSVNIPFKELVDISGASDFIKTVFSFRGGIGFDLSKPKDPGGFSSFTPVAFGDIKTVLSKGVETEETKLKLKQGKGEKKVPDGDTITTKVSKDDIQISTSALVDFARQLSLTTNMLAFMSERSSIFAISLPDIIDDSKKAFSGLEKTIKALSSDSVRSLIKFNKALAEKDIALTGELRKAFRPIEEAVLSSPKAGKITQDAVFDALGEKGVEDKIVNALEKQAKFAFDLKDIIRGLASKEGTKEFTGAQEKVRKIFDMDITKKDLATEAGLTFLSGLEDKAKTLFDRVQITQLHLINRTTKGREAGVPKIEFGERTKEIIRGMNAGKGTPLNPSTMLDQRLARGVKSTDRTTKRFEADQLSSANLERIVSKDPADLQKKLIKSFIKDSANAKKQLVNLFKQDEGLDIDLDFRFSARELSLKNLTDQVRKSVSALAEGGMPKKEIDIYVKNVFRLIGKSFKGSALGLEGIAKEGLIKAFEGAFVPGSNTAKEAISLLIPALKELSLESKGIETGPIREIVGEIAKLGEQAAIIEAGKEISKLQAKMVIFGSSTADVNSAVQIFQKTLEKIIDTSIDSLGSGFSSSNIEIQSVISTLKGELDLLKDIESRNNSINKALDEGAAIIEQRLGTQASSIFSSNFTDVLGAIGESLGKSRISSSVKSIFSSLKGLFSISPEDLKLEAQRKTIEQLGDLRSKKWIESQKEAGQQLNMAFIEKMPEAGNLLGESIISTLEKKDIFKDISNIKVTLEKGIIVDQTNIYIGKKIGEKEPSLSLGGVIGTAGQMPSRGPLNEPSMLIRVHPGETIVPSGTPLHKTLGEIQGRLQRIGGDGTKLSAAKGAFIKKTLVSPGGGSFGSIIVNLNTGDFSAIVKGFARNVENLNDEQKKILKENRKLIESAVKSGQDKFSGLSTGKVTEKGGNVLAKREEIISSLLKVKGVEKSGNINRKEMIGTKTPVVDFIIETPGAITKTAKDIFASSKKGLVSIKETFIKMYKSILDDLKDPARNKYASEAIGKRPFLERLSPLREDRLKVLGDVNEALSKEYQTGKTQRDIFPKIDLNPFFKILARDFSNFLPKSVESAILAGQLKAAQGKRVESLAKGQTGKAAEAQKEVVELTQALKDLHYSFDVFNNSLGSAAKVFSLGFSGPAMGAVKGFALGALGLDEASANALVAKNKRISRKIIPEELKAEFLEDAEDEPGTRFKDKKGREYITTTKGIVAASRPDTIIEGKELESLKSGVLSIEKTFSERLSDGVTDSLIKIGNAVGKLMNTAVIEGFLQKNAESAKVAKGQDIGVDIGGSTGQSIGLAVGGPAGGAIGTLVGKIGGGVIGAEIARAFETDAERQLNKIKKDSIAIQQRLNVVNVGLANSIAASNFILGKFNESVQKVTQDIFSAISSLGATRTVTKRDVFGIRDVSPDIFDIGLVGDTSIKKAKKRGMFDTLSEASGKKAGLMLSGAMIGMYAGSFLGPAGALLGAGIGAGVGGIAGMFIDDPASKQSRESFSLQSSIFDSISDSVNNLNSPLAKFAQESIEIARNGKLLAQRFRETSKEIEIFKKSSDGGFGLNLEALFQEIAEPARQSMEIQLDNADAQEELKRKELSVYEAEATALKKRSRDKDISTEDMISLTSRLSEISIKELAIKGELNAIEQTRVNATEEFNNKLAAATNQAVDFADSMNDARLAGINLTIGFNKAVMGISSDLGVSFSSLMGNLDLSSINSLSSVGFGNTINGRRFGASEINADENKIYEAMSTGDFGNIGKVMTATGSVIRNSIGQIQAFSTDALIEISNISKEAGERLKDLSVIEVVIEGEKFRKELSNRFAAQSDFLSESFLDIAITGFNSMNFTADNYLSQMEKNIEQMRVLTEHKFSAMEKAISEFSTNAQFSKIEDVKSAILSVNQGGSGADFFNAINDSFKTGFEIFKPSANGVLEINASVKDLLGKDIKLQTELIRSFDRGILGAGQGMQKALTMVINSTVDLSDLGIDYLGLNTIGDISKGTNLSETQRIVSIIEKTKESATDVLKKENLSETEQGMVYGFIGEMDNLISVISKGNEDIASYQDQSVDLLSTIVSTQETSNELLNKIRDEFTNFATAPEKEREFIRQNLLFLRNRQNSILDGRLRLTEGGEVNRISEVEFASLKNIDSGMGIARTLEEFNEKFGSQIVSGPKEITTFTKVRPITNNINIEINNDFLDPSQLTGEQSYELARKMKEELIKIGGNFGNSGGLEK